MFTMTKSFAAAFACAWVDAWNAQDLPKILSYYSQDFCIESPLASIIRPQSGGTIIGKEEVEKYWNIALEISPSLQFELLAVLVGGASLAVHLFNKSSNRKSIEIMSFDEEGKVCKAIVCYA